MEATAMEEEIEAHSDFATEFRIYCTELHQNFVENGKELQVMTIDIEKRIIEYLLQSQENEQCPTLLSGWLEQYVFCVVANMEQTTFELHIWNEDQKKAVSMENYYSILSTLYSEYGRITADSFVEKVNEQFALIPEQIIRYFIDHCSGSKEVKKIPPKVTLIENKENRTYGCRVVNYDYVKKRVLKRKVVTEVFDKRSGKILHSIQKEEEPKEDYFYCIEKNDRLCDISNFHQTEISSTMYNSTQLLEVSYKDSKVKTYLPPDEIQNQEQLIILSDVIYKDREFSSSLCGEIHMEFVIPPKRDRSAIDLQSIFSTSFQPKSESEMPKSHAVKTPAPKPKPKTPRKVQPPPPVKPAGKLAIVNNPITKEQTLKCLPVDSDVQQDSQELSYSALSAAAIDVKDTDDNENFAFDTIEDGTATGTDKNDEESTDIVGSVQVIKTEVEDPTIEISPLLVNDNSTGETIDVICNVINCNVVNDDHIYGNSPSKSERNSDHARFNKEDTSVNKYCVFYCDLCDHISTTEKALNRHKLGHNPEKLPHKCNICSKAFLCAGNLNEHMKTHKGSPKVQCDLCPKLVYSQRELKKHKSYVHVEEKYLCTVCGKRFKQERNLVNHVRQHTNEKPFQCQDCGKSHRNKVTLEQHRKHHHSVEPEKSGAKPIEFICDFCSATFTCSSALCTHKKQHEGSVPFECDVCNKTFTFKDSLKDHYLTHTKEPSHTCSYCFKKFCTERRLKNHVKNVHVPYQYQCFVCDKTYKEHRKLIEHMTVHTGEKPFSCRICQKAFRVKAAVYAHEKTHSDEMEHICPICKKGFHFHSNMRRHMKVHKSENL